MFILRWVKRFWDRWPPGLFVAMLGLLAALFPLVASATMPPREKFFWASGFASLVILESFAILKERAKQEKALADQQVGLNNIRDASEEHMKSMMRLLLTRNESSDSLKTRALKLSEAILDFVYQRLQNAPPQPGYPEILMIGLDTETWSEKFFANQAKMNAASRYEFDTLAIYRERFASKALAILGEFKAKGAVDDSLDYSAAVPAGSQIIKIVGQRIGELAERLEPAESA